MNNHDPVILDSWAVLAWLQGEPSAAVVSDLLAWSRGDEEAATRSREATGHAFTMPRLLVNIVSLGEVFCIVGRRQGEGAARQTLDEIKGSPIEIISASDALVLEAARLKLTHAVAYADAFALATAISQRGTLATGDPELKGITDVPVLWLG